MINLYLIALMKLLRIQLTFIIFITVNGIGCRTITKKEHGNKEKTTFVWENQLSVDLDEISVHSAVEQGDMGKIRELLKKNISLDEKNEFGVTPLQLATVKGNLEVVKLLLKSGADPDGQNFSKQTPLHFAAMNGFEQIAKQLILSGADVNSIDDEYWTPLNCAMWKGKGIINIKLIKKKKVIELLIRNGGKLSDSTNH